MDYTYQFQIYPNVSQKKLISQTFGCVRFVYNYFLNERNTYYEQTSSTKGATDEPSGRKGLSYNQTSKLLTHLKNEKLFLKEVDKFSLQNSLRDLDKSFKNFFDKKNNYGYPKFKSKKKNYPSFRTNFTNNNIQLFENKIKLPKLGLIKRKGYKQIEGKIISCTITLTPTGKYQCSLLVDKEIKPLQQVEQEVGIDLGVKSFATLYYNSNNYEEIVNPKYLKQLEKNLTYHQQVLSKKKIGSNNFKKQKKKVANLHEKISNQRKNFLHQITSRLIRENQTIVIEDLDVKKMLRHNVSPNGYKNNHSLAKQIQQVGLGHFKVYIEYKARWYGRKVIKVDRYFASSQLCSHCGYKNDTVKDLNVREWICPRCQSKHHRDENSAKNIYCKGVGTILTFRLK